MLVARGDIIVVWWPERGRATKEHVAIVLETTAAYDDEVLLAVGTSQKNIGGPGVEVRWTGEGYSWVWHEWPKGSTITTHFYKAFVGLVPVERIRRKIGVMPQLNVDEIVDLF